ncbi:MAG TPA: energy-coupling factor ABC transporter permease, partial [Anaerolineae bacterium]|nr:energy-coupling factor ABC transporter permease [Anaerolineae bacterium]
RRVNKELTERQVPLMGVTAAFIFAAQMLNFTVAGGTSGHLLGGALAAILLGPWAGMLVLTSVLAVQALLFQDGGLLALGANILNMAIVGVLVGWLAYSAVRRLLGDRPVASLAGGFVAAWLSVLVASLLAAAELAVSGMSPWGLVVPAMGSVHMLIGLGEGLITVGVLAFLRAARPDLIALNRAGRTVEGEA